MDRNRAITWPVSSIQKYLESDPCPAHGATLPAYVLDSCPACARRWDYMCSNPPPGSLWVHKVSLPSKIAADIDEYLQANPHSTTPWNMNGQMPLERALDYWLRWQGVVGYTTRILTIFERARNV